jgi:hypothetical protein
LQNTEGEPFAIENERGDEQVAATTATSLVVGAVGRVLDAPGSSPTVAFGDRRTRGVGIVANGDFLFECEF